MFISRTKKCNVDDVNKQRCQMNEFIASSPIIFKTYQRHNGSDSVTLYDKEWFDFFLCFKVV